MRYRNFATYVSTHEVGFIYFDLKVWQSHHLVRTKIVVEIFL